MSRSTAICHKINNCTWYVNVWPLNWSPSDERLVHLLGHALSRETMNNHLQSFINREALSLLSSGHFTCLTVILNFVSSVDKSGSSITLGERRQSPFALSGVIHNRGSKRLWVQWPLTEQSQVSWASLMCLADVPQRLYLCWESSNGDGQNYTHRKTRSYKLTRNIGGNTFFI